jgi:hypothetical protein
MCAKRLLRDVGLLEAKLGEVEVDGAEELCTHLVDILMVKQVARRI